MDANIRNTKLQVLEPLSDYYISKRRLRFCERMLGRGGFGTVKLADLWPTTWIPFVTRPTAVAVKELQRETHDGVPLRTAIVSLGVPFC